MEPNEQTENQPSNEDDKIPVGAFIGGLALIVIVMCLFLISDSKSAFDDQPRYPVQSIEFLQSETPKIINDETPTIRITTDDGLLLLRKNQIGYRISENDEGYTVIRTHGFVHVDNGNFVSSPEYTLYITADKEAELREQYAAHFGEPIYIINDGKKE